MKIRVNKDVCIACGACYAVAPEVYQMDDDGMSEVINEVIPAELEDEAMEALEGCPTEAIYLVTEEEN